MEAKKFFIKSQWELTAWQFVNFTGVGALGTICHYLVLIFFGECRTDQSRYRLSMWFNFRRCCQLPAELSMDFSKQEEAS